MKKMLIKQLLSFLLLVLFMFPAWSSYGAENLVDMVGNGGLKAIGSEAYGTRGAATDVRVVAANIIKKLLGFLGILLIGIIIYAGFLWTTAGGDAKKVDTAKDWIKNSVVGMIIIFSSYQLANFILDCVIRSVDDKGSSIWGGLCN